MIAAMSFPPLVRLHSAEGRIGHRGSIVMDWAYGGAVTLILQGNRHTVQASACSMKLWAPRTLNSDGRILLSPIDGHQP